MGGFIFTADTHLCLTNVKKHRSMVQDSWISLSAIVGACISNQAELVIGGDVFDSTRPDPATFSHFAQQMHRLSGRGLHCYFISGQHDRGPQPWPSIVPGVFCLDCIADGSPVYIKLCSESVALYGMSWKPPEEAAEAVSKIQKTEKDGVRHVFVGHQVWANFSYGASEFDLKNLPKWFNYALVGDYHIPKAMRTGHVKTYSPGSISMMSIDEPPKKTCLYFRNTMEDPDDITIPTRQHIKKEISTEDDLHALLLECKSWEPTQPWGLPMAHILYSPSIKGARGAIAAELSGKCHLWLKAVRDEEAQEEGEAVSLGATGEDGVMEAIHATLKGEERDIAVKLWGSENPKEELSSMVDALKGGAQ